MIWKIKVDMGVILRMTFEEKGVEIIEANSCKNHIHILVSILPKFSVSNLWDILMGNIKNQIQIRFSIWRNEFKRIYRPFYGCVGKKKQ